MNQQWQTRAFKQFHGRISMRVRLAVCINTARDAHKTRLCNIEAALAIQEELVVPFRAAVSERTAPILAHAMLPMPATLPLPVPADAAGAASHGGEERDPPRGL